MALDGFEASAGARAPASRMPFLNHAKPDAREVAEAVFKGGAGSGHGVPNHGDQVGTVVSRMGRVARVEIRRRRLVEAGQIEFSM